MTLRNTIEENFIMCILVVYIIILIFLNWKTFKTYFNAGSVLNPLLIAIGIMLVVKLFLSLTACDNAIEVEFTNINRESYRIPSEEEIFGGKVGGGTRVPATRNAREIFLKKP